MYLKDIVVNSRNSLEISGKLPEWKTMKLSVTLQRNKTLTKSIQSPQAALDDVASCQTAEWTSCSASNSLATFCS